MEIVTTIVDYVPETLCAKVQLQPVGLDVDTGHEQLHDTGLLSRKEFLPKVRDLAIEAMAVA